jgi:hypothetical protein
MNSKRKPIIAGNWKMNKTATEARDLAAKLIPLVSGAKDREIVLAPTFTSIPAVAEIIKGTNLALAAQDVYWEDKGAFTGEISAEMLLDLGCKYVIIGHSERRQFFGETDETVNKKVMKALNKGLFPIVCVGELLNEREAGRVNLVIERQDRYPGPGKRGPCLHPSEGEGDIQCRGSGFAPDPVRRKRDSRERINAHGQTGHRRSTRGRRKPETGVVRGAGEFHVETY